MGYVIIPGKNHFYQIISDPDSYAHYLLKVDLSNQDVPECHPEPIPALTREDEAELHRIKKTLQQSGKDAEAEATISWLIAYTPAAKEWADMHGGGFS